MKARILLVALGAAAALAVLVPGDDPRAQPQPAAIEAPPATVEVAPASAADIASVQWVPGTVLSRADAQIASEQAGRVLSIAEVGERVEQGGVIARLDAAALELAVREVEAALARIAAQLEYQERQLGRLAALKRRSSVAETQLDESRNQRDLLQHDRTRAEVALAETRRQLREATVRAPFGGVVAERRAQPGEFLAAGAVLVRLVDTAHIEVGARVPVVLGAALRPGDPLAVRAGGSAEVVASVRAVVPGGDAQSHQLELRIALPPDSWPIGAALQVGVPAGSAQAAVAVPRDALVLRGSETFVFRVGADRKAERVAVETGRSSGTLVEVLGGIAIGDTLVVRGAERLAPGQAVAIREPS